MRRVLVQVWGPDGASYAGRGMTLYRDPEVTFGGVKVGGIRISHMSNMEADVIMSLTASKKARLPFKVRILREVPKPESEAAAKDDVSILTDAEHLKLAQAAARRGTEAFKKWWNTDAGKDARPVAKPAIDSLQAIATAADAAIAADPFGLPPLVDEEVSTLTPEQQAQQEAALAAFKVEQHGEVAT